MTTPTATRLVVQCQLGQWWLLSCGPGEEVLAARPYASQEAAEERAMIEAEEDPGILQVDIYDAAGDWQRTSARVSPR